MCCQPVVKTVSDLQSLLKIFMTINFFIAPVLRFLENCLIDKEAYSEYQISMDKI